MAQQDLDLHASEPPAASPTQSTTNDALAFVKISLGAAGNATFAALSAALGILTTGLVAAIADLRAQVRTLATNKSALITAAPLKVPTVKPPDLSGAIRTISSVTGSINTPDMTKVNQAAAAASSVRNPDRVAAFKATVINQISDETNEEVLALGDQLKAVQGVRNQVGST
jgi:hypothetical protein